MEDFFMKITSFKTKKPMSCLIGFKYIIKIDYLVYSTI